MPDAKPRNLRVPRIQFLQKLKRLLLNPSL